jgi:hypothetical protein
LSHIPIRHGSQAVMLVVSLQYGFLRR